MLDPPISFNSVEAEFKFDTRVRVSWASDRRPGVSGELSTREETRLRALFPWFCAGYSRLDICRTKAFVKP